jgi:hypothetical protein
MTGREILRELQQARSGERRFIKWWRKENDFADYELVDTFLASLEGAHEFAGFELLTKEQMWQELMNREPKRVMLGKRHGETVIRWQHVAEDGTIREEIFPYDAPSLMTVFDGETRGDTICC